jgi:hypothetical protein
MTASAGTRGELCRGRASPAKTTLSGQKPGSLPQRELCEAHLAALHELSERLTATTNYLAAGLRLSEMESALAVRPLRHTEILEKAFGQVSRANEVIRRFRKLFDPPKIKAGPVYRVCFLNEFAKFSNVVRPCQRTIIIRSARSRERAIEAAKKRFARLEGIRDWRTHAKIIEVSIVDAYPLSRSGRLLSPAGEQDEASRSAAL